MHSEENNYFYPQTNPKMNTFLKRSLTILPLGLVLMSMMTSCKGSKDKDLTKDSTKAVAKGPTPGDTM